MHPPVGVHYQPTHLSIRRIISWRPKGQLCSRRLMIPRNDAVRPHKRRLINVKSISHQRALSYDQPFCLHKEGARTKPSLD